MLDTALGAFTAISFQWDSCLICKQLVAYKTTLFSWLQTDEVVSVVSGA